MVVLIWIQRMKRMGCMGIVTFPYNRTEAAASNMGVGVGVVVETVL